ncbi:hypothetical protein BJ508DRAFT_375014 [Ascobolus immersus RN42]|uniref:DUF7918 domain-containing protein n=1 Tax=Ascobolus immersus RN42 TaxID=1160509 RepID=A0A3N4ID49_ASCIM|nr:hypothetical protein BJ508DRAFT_375014 [Ascobolus immersus RN42]
MVQQTPIAHNFTVQVLCADGTPLRTYPCRHLDEPEELNTTTVYIETPPSDQDQTFSVKVEPIKPIDYTLTRGYAFRLHVDGFSQSFFVRNRGDVPERASMKGNIKESITVPDKQNPSTFTEHKMKFSPLDFVSDQDEADSWNMNVAMNSEIGGLGGTCLDNVGSIKVEVREIESTGSVVKMPRKTGVPSITDKRMVYEGDKKVKGRGVSHGVSLTTSVRKGEYRSHISTYPQVLGTVIFHYRSRRALIALGIIDPDAADYVAVSIRRNVSSMDLTNSDPTVHRTTQVVVPASATSTIPPVTAAPSNPWSVTSLITGVFTSQNRQRAKEYQTMETEYPDIDDDDFEMMGDGEKGNPEVSVVRPDGTLLRKTDPEVLAERRRQRTLRQLKRKQIKRASLARDGGMEIDGEEEEVDLTVLSE